MIEWIKNLLGIQSTYSVSFDTIVAPIQKVVADLETHGIENLKLYDAKSAEAERLLDQANLCKSEVAKANAAAAKFKALIAA